MMKTSNVSIVKSFFYFAFFTLMLYIATRHVIPVFNGWGFHPAISWFIASGVLIFIPIFFLAILNVKKELNTNRRETILARLWLTNPSSKDWVWAMAGVILISILTGVIIFVADWVSQSLLGKPLQTSPSFMRFDPFQTGQYWIYLVWIVFFFFNIVGEEIMWRGYLLAGMSEKYPKTAWFFNAVFWMMFHIPFGIELMIMVLPTFFLIPYLVQKRKNTWIGIVIHAGLNGPGFILVTSGILNH
jgi:membrane protease YdiL (CAAX protease family)